ncbi:MAG: hypothetical protein QM487_02255 [Candidatus Marithrix sp.]
MKTIFLVLAFLMTSNCYSQQSIPFDSDNWEITSKTSKLETYLGKESLFLPQGFAIAKDVQLMDGTIEYDVAFSEKRGFMGVVWRLQDLENHEHFYIRSHQSGNPDSIQYTPIFNGSSAWQLYYGAGHSTAVKHSFDKWVHIKLIISGKQAEVYIDDMESPALSIHDLKHEVKSGKFGIVVGPGTPAHFANFSYTAESKLSLKEKLVTPKGSIMSWSVSNSFAEKSLKNYLTNVDKQNLTWNPLVADYSGIINLAKVQTHEKVKNSAFAKVTIVSEFEQVKPLKFGFSDRAKVYLNDQLIYSGDNTYRSRDYRFLGTIGYFDELYLPLKKGNNELWIAVSENFGGWGIQAKFADMAGISIK